MAELTNEQLCEMFDAYLDENFCEIQIFSMFYKPAEILKKCDPDGYKEQIIYFISACIDDGTIYEHSDHSYHDQPERLKGEWSWLK